MQKIYTDTSIGGFAMNLKLISVVVPMYFEEQVVEECYNRLTVMAVKNNLNYELVFVDDGSRDKTPELLETIAKGDLRVKVVRLSRNFGHQAAVTAGIDNASGDCIVIIDADLQDPPEIIPEMVKLWLEGYEVVYGKRKSREGENLFKLITAKIYYRVLDKMCSVKIPLDTGDFRLIDRKVAEALKNMHEHNRFLRGMCSWAGFKQIPIEYERKERFAGKTKYPVRKMFKLALDGIASFSTKPLKFIEYIGAIFILTALLLLLQYIISTFSDYDVSSKSLKIVFIATILMGGIQLLSIGIIGEYIARIYEESKGRPLYIVDKKINLNYKVTHLTSSIHKSIKFRRDLIKPIQQIEQHLLEENEYNIK